MCRRDTKKHTHNIVNTRAQMTVNCQRVVIAAVDLKLDTD